MPLQDPLFIVDVLEFDQSLSQLFDGGEGLYPEQILFEQTNELPRGKPRGIWSATRQFALQAAGYQTQRMN